MSNEQRENLLGRVAVVQMMLLREASSSERQELNELGGDEDDEDDEDDEEASDRAVLRDGLAQLSSGGGESANKPLRRLDVGGFYLLIDALGFKVIGQRAYEHPEGILDSMTVRLGDDGEGFVLFNLVAPDSGGDP